MKPYAILFGIVFTIITTASAQKSGLINSRELLKQGATLHDSSEYKKALALYDKISRSDTNYVRALYEKALTCEADSQFTKAISYCREGLSLKEQREYEPELYSVYGSALTDMQKYDEAIKVFDAGLVKYPQSSLIYFNKGLALMGLNRLHDAELIFQQTVIINPYMYSGHYQLALAAAKQGKLIPAFLSCVGYLLMNPEGRYFSKSINMLSLISKSADEALELKNKRTEAPDAAYQMVEDIVLSKIALDKQYKPIIALDDMLSRQIQVVFEKLDYDSSSKDFWIQYYVPYFKQVYKQGKFELLINHIFSNANVPQIQDFNKKNKKALDNFTSEAGDYFGTIRSTRELQYNRRDTVTSRYAYEDGKLAGKGVLINNGKNLTGPWTFYYPAGNLKGKGIYSPTGQREGEWKYYYFNGSLKSIQHLVNGKSEGPQDYYFENGNVSSHEVEVNDQLEGFVTTYYYGGAKKMEATYKAGKKDGLEKLYYTSGKLKATNNYANGVLNGAAREYYQNGMLQAEGQYLNGKTEGPYKSYHEMGGIATEMTFVKDKLDGEWKSYHTNGKLKEKRNYVNDVEEGQHQEYYDNGQLTVNYVAKKAKINGETLYYTRAGKVFSSLQYDNGIVKAAKYFDPAGKELSSATLKNNMIDLVSFSASGVKTEHATYNQLGNTTGPDTLFYPSGKVRRISQYTKGELNGLVVNYYLSGKRKSQINMTDGKENGYYESFHVNGQPEAEGWIQMGEDQGEWLYYDVNGKLSSKTYYVDSNISGYKEEFSPNGKKTIEQKYDTGLLEKMIQYDELEKVIAVDSFPKGSGKYTILYPNGKVNIQTNYVNGNLNGAYKTLYVDGSPESIFYYKGGLLDSTSVSYYYGGVKHSERQYQMGNKIGKWKVYEEDGTLSTVTTYVNDMANGERIYYNNTGTKDFVSPYKDDELNGIAEKYDIAGALAYQALFEDDKIVSYSYLDKDNKMVPFIPVSAVNGQFKAYYANGKVSRECLYSDGLRNGVSKVYYATGQLRTEDTVLLDVNEGSSKEYYPNGKLKSEYNYAADVLDGAGKEYYNTGVLKYETTYLAGDNHGPTKYYDANGKLTKTLLYYYGRLISVKNEK